MIYQSPQTADRPESPEPLRRPPYRTYPEPQEMNSQKITITLIMVVLLSCQAILAAPFQAMPEERANSGQLLRSISEAVSSIVDEDMVPLSRNRRYVVIQVMGKLAQDDRQYQTRLHPRHHRFHHRHRQTQNHIKKQ
ncbi:hypothetical protein SNE40_001353 [Patella caerulea]|uniref:Uncharacterized protein n=1 Tax=Patella caerulea TaxID=87958 RepID=A0AAN8KHB8_PATCE